MLKWLYLAGLLSVVGSALGAEDLEFRAPANVTAPTTAAQLRSLAVRALPVYQNADRARFLATLAALQSVAGEYAAAQATQQSLDELERERHATPSGPAIVYAMYTRARARASAERIPFDRAFARVFREVVAPLADRDAYRIDAWLSVSPDALRRELQLAFAELDGKQRIALSEAIALIERYRDFDAYRSLAPLVGPLIAEDDARRYIVDDAVLIRTPARASIAAILVRPRSPSGRLAALLEFTIDANAGALAKECAAHGYVGVVAFARGKHGSPDVVAPYEHDGDDARAVIDWIVKQPWSDGRVAMYGSGYSGFAAWAAAKRAPTALRALAVSSPNAPGIDPPELDRIAGVAPALYRRWLAHPALDAYWQRMMPYEEDFAALHIPVLTTTGYYDEHERGSLYYFTQYARHAPSAEETLLIGPYDAAAMRAGPSRVLDGYSIDPAAQIDLRELRYQWFDHVLKSAPQPALLSQRINFEVMGANAWRHVASLDAMGRGTVRLYLDPLPAGDFFRLVGHEPAVHRSIEQSVAPAAAAPAAAASGPILASDFDPPPGSLTYVSGLVQRSIEVSGSLLGRLTFASDGGPLAVALSLYELEPSGEYLELFAPPARFEVDSTARGGGGRRTHAREHWSLTTDRLTSVRFAAGSRIVAVLSAYRPGSGAGATTVKWFASSYIELPVERDGAGR